MFVATTLLSSFLWASIGVSALSATEHVCHDHRRELEAILSSPAFAGSTVGFEVRDTSDNTLLFQYHSNVPLVPASNMKLISTAAALHYLGPEHRFSTDAYGHLDTRSGQVRSPLYIKGDGDPWLVPERIWLLANRLYYRGVRQIRGDIIVDDSGFEGPREANGWQQDRTSFAYMAPTGAVSVGFNTVLVHIYPGSTDGSPARVLLEPPQGYLRVDNMARTTSRGRSSLTIDVEKEGARSVVRVRGNISNKETGRGYYRRIDNPALYAGEVLKTQLQRLGIKVRGRVRRGAVNIEKFDRLARLTSPRLAELIGRINKHSNNFMAEQVALATGAAVLGGPGSWAKAEVAIGHFLSDEVGLSPDGFQVKNASGLHDVNRFSPHDFVALLSYMAHRPRIRTEYMASLSVAGSVGTLAGRMRDSEAKGMLRAKTGTLSIASALSGYVNAHSGELLAFSLLINHYKVPIAEIWAAQDEVGTTLANFDSRCAPQETLSHRALVRH